MVRKVNMNQNVANLLQKLKDKQKKAEQKKKTTPKKVEKPQKQSKTIQKQVKKPKVVEKKPKQAAPKKEKLKKTQQKKVVAAAKETKKQTPKKQQQQKPSKQQKSAATSNTKESYKTIKLGFIGIGTIVKSMVQGLCNQSVLGQNVASQVFVSPRNEQNSKELTKKFKQVKRCQSNQEVIDKSDWVIVGLLTTAIPEIFKTLKFRKEQTIINLAAMPNEKFTECVVGTKKIVRACPLPPIALNVGATIVSPPNKPVEEMFNALGNSVTVKTSHETYSLQGIACLQGAQFATMQATYEWMVNVQKVDSKVAKEYIMGTYYSILVDARDKVMNKGLSFQDLVDEQTPGGLNEQNIRHLEKKKVFREFQNVLTETYLKMTKKK